jgi:hypothetical protein
VADFVAVDQVEGSVLGGEGGDGAEGGAGAGADLVSCDFTHGGFEGARFGGAGFGGAGFGLGLGGAFGIGVGFGGGLPDLVGDGDGFHDDGAVATPGGEGHGVDEGGLVLVGGVEGGVEGGGEFDELFGEFAFDDDAVGEEAVADGVAGGPGPAFFVNSATFAA